MKEKTKHHDFFKQFKTKSDLIEYIETHTPNADKRPIDQPGMCCGWCKKPITGGVEVSKNNFKMLCPQCLEIGTAWDKEKGVEY